MSDERPIDLDELINSILQNKAEKTDADSTAVFSVDDILPPTDSGLPAQEEVLPPVETPEEPPAVQPVETPIPPMPEIAPEEELPPAGKKEKEKKRKKKLPFGHKADRDDYEDDEEDPEWVDWGLKPIGHYHVEDAPAQPEVTPEDAAAEPAAPAAEETPDEMPAPVVNTDPEPTPAPMPVITRTMEIDGILSDIPERPVAPVQEADEPEEYPAIATPAPTVAPIEEDDELPVVQPYPAADAPETPQVPPKEAATRVITLPTLDSTTFEIDKKFVIKVSESEQVPDQLSMEEMIATEENGGVPPVDPETQLRENRRAKVRGFSLREEEEEEENEPEEIAEEAPEETVTEEFNSYSDAHTIQTELTYRRHSSFAALILTGVLELIVLLLALISNKVGSPIGTTGYLIVQIFAFVVMAALNYRLVFRGLTGLFTLRANTDTGVSLVLAVAIVSLLGCFIDGEVLPLWTPLPGIVLVASSLAQYCRCLRIEHNFSFVAYPSDKYAANLLEDQESLKEIGRRVSLESEARVAYFRRTSFLTDYIANANEPDIADDWSAWMTPALFVLSLVLSVLMLLVGKIEGFSAWLTAVNLLLPLSTVAGGLSLQIALNRSTHQMLLRGGFMVGWKAVRLFGQPDGVVLDAAELYPNESMLLHGIKTFSGAHIDDAIVDAASLQIRAGGPLSLIFKRIIQNDNAILREVDSLVFEQGMGVSGWVDGRRVLVGNRRLLENHGVHVPSSDYEAKYVRDNRKIVYLSTGGELSAMFVVSYLPDESIKTSLQELSSAKVPMLIRSCDQNITAESLCDCFDLDAYYVEVLPAAAGRLYDTLVHQEAESEPALLASNGHILGTAWALAFCRKMFRRCRITLIVQMLMAVLSLLFGVMMILSGNSGYLPGALSCLLGTSIISALLAFL